MCIILNKIFIITIDSYYDVHSFVFDGVLAFPIFNKIELCCGNVKRTWKVGHGMSQRYGKLFQVFFRISQK